MVPQSIGATQPFSSSCCPMGGKWGQVLVHIFNAQGLGRCVKVHDHAAQKVPEAYSRQTNCPHVVVRLPPLLPAVLLVCYECARCWSFSLASYRWAWAMVTLTTCQTAIVRSWNATSNWKWVDAALWRWPPECIIDIGSVRRWLSVVVHSLVSTVEVNQNLLGCVAIRQTDHVNSPWPSLLG